MNDPQQDVALSLRRVVDALDDIATSLDDLHSLLSLVATLAFPEDGAALKRRYAKSYQSEAEIDTVNRPDGTAREVDL